MKTVIADDEDREWFQRAMGYGLTGEATSQCFLVIQNKGGSGTSTTMLVLSKVLGEYMRTSDPRTWLDIANMRSAADASPDRAALAGDTRLCYCEEPSRNAQLNESLIKQACGGGAPINARHLNHAPFDYLPHFLLVISCNRIPRIKSDDDGIWRRLRLLRFRRQFTEEEQRANRDIAKRLGAEAPGILNWCLAGMAAWRAKGLQPTERMKEDIRAHRDSTNAFHPWFHEWIDTSDPKHRETIKALYDHYKNYCEQEGVGERDILSKRFFGMAFDDLQIASGKSDKDRQRIGVRLRTDVEVFGEALSKF